MKKNKNISYLILLFSRHTLQCAPAKLNRMYLCFLVLLFSFISINVWAGYQQVSIEELINNPDKYDQEIISFQAEAIGEPLYTESGNWFNVTCGSYHLGVFVEEKSFIENIKYWGSYSEKGDRVEVKGVFYQNCPDHYQLGIHLLDLKIKEKGKALEHLVSPEKIKLAFFSLIICLTMGVIYFIRVQWLKKSKR